MKVIEERIQSKPFLKWAGGKTQLLNAITDRLPKYIFSSFQIDRYIEPFIGSGAVFFFLKKHFHINKSYLIDSNPELILGYRVVQKEPNLLIKRLEQLQNDYLKLSEENRSKYFYQIRNQYNTQRKSLDYMYCNKDWIERASWLIFLNKTCYNGLFRLNKKGDFNVPFGRYKNPAICDKKTITEASYALQDSEIICGDFSLSSQFIQNGTLVYLDPPYRPINSTSSFTSYSKEGFSENDQKRLAQFFREMDKRGAFLIQSNSDPKNENPEDIFFDELYKGYVIERVPAKRFINCNANRRGEINELIIRNYGEKVG